MIMLKSSIISSKNYIKKKQQASNSKGKLTWKRLSKKSKSKQHSRIFGKRFKIKNKCIDL